MYTLYSLPGSCSTGITILLTKLNLDFKIVKREDVANYKEIVPTNQVPALQYGDQIITEGAAIALYLLEKHQSDMLPQDISQKGEFLKYLMFNYATLHPSYSKLFATNAMMEESEEKQKLMTKLAASLSRNWEILNKRLEDRKFIFSDKPTIIDYLLAVYSGWNKNFPTVDIKFGKNVENLIARIKELPEFKEAYKKEGI